MGMGPPRTHAVEPDDYSRGVVCIQNQLDSGRVQTRTRPKSAATIDLRRPFFGQSQSIPFHRGRSISVDNFQGGHWTTLSTAEPGTPLVSVGRLRGKQTRRNRTDSSPTNLMESTLTPLSSCPKNGDHLLHRHRPSRQTQGRRRFLHLAHPRGSRRRQPWQGPSG